MLPEVEQFVAALDAAAEKMAAASAAVDVKCDYTADGWDCPRCVALKPIKAEHRRDAATAWEALAASTDPLVRWIVEHCKGYMYEAQMILEALPAPMDELEDIARSEGWCYVWERYVSDARIAGVLPKADTEVSA